MADVKPDIRREMPLTSRERHTAAEKDIVKKPEARFETEHLKSLERARKQVIEELLQAETPPPPAIQPVGSVSLPEAQRQKQIEATLAAGLEEVYVSLTPEKQREFRKVGEETARKINRLLNKAKINVGDIIKLIKKWLAIIPGLNKYFLEKEAKIKADELIKLRK